ncbi:protein-export chaperone SecB [Azohydromonas australica]|uniref:protein-export chaperone SecB n=1 Tax=Azohydromonas australica TaxID=364039 RepID=UPI0012EB6EF9|nr:protein-export chaperone SecB [Azohydromonas australica]
MSIEVDDAHVPADPPNPLTTVYMFDGVNIATDVGIQELDMHHERGQIYGAVMRVIVDNTLLLDAEDQQFSPYLIDVEISGVILIPKGAEQLAPPKDLATVNGAALLWSSVREQVLSVTARMPAGPVMLPTVHFQDLRQAPAENAASADAAVPPPPARKKGAPKRTSQ